MADLTGIPDTDSQIAYLRQRMASAAKRTDALMQERKVRRQPSNLSLAVPGREVATPLGVHYESVSLFEGHRRHGNFEIGRLAELPHDLLDGITEGEVPNAPPESWLFLDTETTGLAGGSGTCAFLIGLGRVTPDGFEVRQYFMRDFAEESSQLHAVTEALAGAQVLVTYNGKSFDIPLLETRYRMSRAKPPFGALPHLDLLYGSRRIWRLRLESCRLTELETQILGHEREDDIPGELIPDAYFEFVRTGRAGKMGPVFLHNALDIVSLACLTAVVPSVFRDGGRAELRHAAEFVAMGRWLRQAGRMGEARDLFREAIRRNLREDLLFRTLWDLAAIEKKLDARDAAVALYTDLAACVNAHRRDAMIELAKHYEHRERNYAMAIEFTEAALALADDAELRRRRDRLLARSRQTLLDVRQATT